MPKQKKKNGKAMPSRTAISSRLRKGDIAAIARKTGYDASHVGRVLHGLRSNPSGEIMKAAQQMIGRRKVNA